MLFRSQQLHAAERVIKDGLNVRQTEELVTHLQNERAKPITLTTGHAPLPPANRDTHVADLENRIREKLGAKVQLRYRDGKGALEVRFFNDTELERVLQILGVKMD